MANKVIPNYDNTLVGEYIRQIENPDSIGWNSIRKIWEAPALSGYDKRNRGMGIDILNNEDAKTLTENRPGRYLTESEERQLRNKHIDYLYGAIDRHKDTIPGLIDMSPRKEAEVMGALYRGDAKKLWSSETPIGKALRSDNEEDFHKAISDYYNSEGLKERANNNDAFWMNHAQPATEPVQSSIKSIFDQTTNTVKDAIHQIVPHGASGRWSEGGSLNSPWDGLSLQEKAEMMKVAVRNGITDLKTIKEKYNEFAEGGNILDGGGGLTPSQEAMRYFMNKGLTDYQAAGLVGNLIRESQLIPTATNAGSGAYGIAQWLGPRKKALVSRYGKSPSLQQQLDFVWDELNSTHKTGLSKLKSSRDVAEAARNAMGYYEFSAGPEAAVREMKKWGQDGEGSIRKGIKLASALFGQPVPEYTIVQEVPVVQEAPAFVPVHPEVFGLPVTRREEPIVFGLPEPTVEAVKMPTEAELKRQERHEGMRRLNMLLGMLNSTDASSPYDGVVSMLTGSRVQPFSIFGEGGGIYIKPENRGKFTRLKERTGHSATWFKEHGTPAQRKMATFALNARHWKHGLGGPLIEAANIYDGTTENSQQMDRRWFDFNTGDAFPSFSYSAGTEPTQQEGSSLQPVKTFKATLPEITVIRNTKPSTWFGVQPNTVVTMAKPEERKPESSWRWTTVSNPRMRQLTASNAAKAFDAAATPVFSWALPNPFRAIDAAQKGDLVGVGKEALKAAGLKGVGALAANPSLVAPGSTFWMNPITQRMVAGAGMAKGFDAAANMAGDYGSWGEGVSDVVNQATGWNPQDSWWGQALAEATNPGWLVNPSRVMGAVGRVGSAVENGVDKVAANAELYNATRKSVVPEGYTTIAPKTMTRVGDVEIDNPNLLYHLDRGNSAGAFSNQGAYVEDGILFPGVAKKEGQLDYSWWNMGKPYATSVKGQPMTRLMTATKDTPGMLQVRSQNYPMGQWTGSKGFVLPSEYVNPEGVNVAGGMYNWRPGYGWRKEAEKVPSLTWGKARTLMQYNDTGSPYQDLGMFTWTRTGKAGEPSINVKSSLFGDFVGEGSEQSVFNSMIIPNEVLKAYIDRGFSSIDAIRDFHRTSNWMLRNRVPFQERVSIRGFLKNPESNTIYPVYGQNKVTPFVSPQQDRLWGYQKQIWEKEIIPELDAKFHAKGYSGSAADGTYTGPMTILDVSPWNIGFNNNNQLRGIDLFVE